MKITKNLLKTLILEEIGGPVHNRQMNSLHVFPGYGAGRQWPSGDPPDNSGKPEMHGRPPYETLGAETQIEDGQVLVVIGKTKYKLMFDNKDLTSGRIVPVGEYKFTIEKHGLDSNINWISDVPVNVKFDAQLEKQILDFSGREVKDE